MLSMRGLFLAFYQRVELGNTAVDAVAPGAQAAQFVGWRYQLALTSIAAELPAANA